jgi:hypothetical protein
MITAALIVAEAARVVLAAREGVVMNPDVVRVARVDTNPMVPREIRNGVTNRAARVGARTVVDMRLQE